MKLRGFRIEPGEVEAALRQEPGIAEAVVVVDGEGESRQLVAYLVARGAAPQVSALRESLRHRLAAYMVPGHFMFLESLPLNANGKVDRRRLPTPDSLAATSGHTGTNRFHSATEELLATLWCDVLNLANVSRDDHFFELGGHSIKAMQLLPRLRRAFEVELPLRSIFEHPTLATMASAVDSLRRSGEVSLPLIEALPSGGEWPLSFAQERLWFLAQLQQSGAGESYGINVALQLESSLDEAALRSALQQLITRHEVLRSQFRECSGHPCVALRPIWDPLVVYDIEDCPSHHAREERIRARAQEQAHRPYDLAADGLVRVTLLSSSTGSALLFSVHHIVADGWSLGILVRDLAALYHAARLGCPADLPALPVQYGDYAAWQRAWLHGPALQKQLTFWRDHLAGAPALLELPTDFPRPAVRTGRGAQSIHAFPASLAAEIKKLGRQQDATLFMTLLAAFQVLVHRYSRQEDFVIGSPVANRTQDQTSNLVGFFVNTLALRCRLSPEETFVQRLAEVRRTAFAAFAHQDLPFERLVSDLQPERALSHSSLFQVMFALENLPVDELHLDGQTARLLPQDSGTAKFDLLVSFSEGADTLTAVWEYSTDLFTAETIAGMARHFECLLGSIAEDPTQQLHALPLMTGTEKQAEVERATAMMSLAYPREATIGQLFEEQVRLRPRAVALVGEADEHLTYAELNTRANRLAHALRNRGVGPDSTVGLALERGVEMIVSLLAILKAGGAYLPLDPGYPTARLALLIEDAAPVVIVSTRDGSPNLPPGTVDSLFLLDECQSELDAQSAENPVCGAHAEDLCYVLYTSGSTGTPKGVCVPHRAVVRLVKNNPFADFSADEVFLQLAPLSFDASTLEIWGPLLHGATLVLYPARPLSLDELDRVLTQHRVTTLWLTAGLFHLVVDQRPQALRGLRQLLAGGDVLSVEHVRRMRELFPACSIINGYGPTENTTFTCCHRVGADETLQSGVPIGQAIAHTSVFLLDGYDQPVPPGVPGELCTGGDGLARGYLNRPELTASRFVEIAGLGRLYRTGDLCRRSPSHGAIEFLGRIDQQVKLRGFRIEPGEVEAALRRLPGVSEAAVLVEGEGANRHLVGYVSPASLDTAELRQTLRSQLPEHLVPPRILAIAELPLNENGKIDRRRLQAALPVEPAAPASADEPRPGVESRLAEIWSKVFPGKPISRHANFFALGGDSILSIQIVARAREAGLHCSVRDLFQHQTVAELALNVTEVATAEHHEPAGPVPLTPIQHWFFARDLAEPWHFNQAVLLRPHEPWDPSILSRALQSVVTHHEAFHLRFAKSDDGWRQFYEPKSGDDWFVLEQEDLRALPPEEQAIRLRERATVWQRSLSLEEGTLTRAVLFHLHDMQCLLWCVHHLAVDAVSWSVLLADLRGALEPSPRVLLPGASFITWARTLDRLAHSPELALETAFWERMPTPAPLPLDFPEGTPSLASTDHVTVSFEPAETRILLEEIHRAYRLRLDDVLLTALALSLRSWTHQPGCLIDLEGHGRVERPVLQDVTRAVGWFTTMHPVHLVLPDSDEASACLKAIKEQIRSIPGDGLAYGLRLHRDAGVWQGRREAPIAFNYLGQFDHLAQDGPFDFGTEGTGESHSALGLRTHLLTFEAMISGGALRVHWSYSNHQFKSETIETLAREFAASLRTLLAHCRLPSSIGYTPADFPLAQLNQDRLDVLSEKHGDNIAALLPLSPMQQGMLFQSLLGGDGPQPYFEQVHCRIEAPFDPGRFRAAWQALLDRHPILRTAFALEETPPRQIVFRAIQLPWTDTDLSGLDSVTQQRRLDDSLAEERARGFDLGSAPLFRCSLAHLGDGSYAFTWCFHHLLLDGWSLPILFRELQALYVDAQAPLPARRPYGDYIGWLSRQDATSAASHWRRELAGFESPTPLPGGSIHPTTRGGSADSETLFTIDAHTSQRVFEFAAGRHLTVNTLLQAAWALLLQRMSGEKEVVFGVTVSGRDIDLPGVEGMLGILINTLPLRVAFDEETLGPWLQNIQQRHQGNMPFGYVSLAEIQRGSDLPSGTPLFHTIFVFENYPTAVALPSGDMAEGLTLGAVQAVDRTHYPLTMVAGASECIHLRLGYDSRCFDSGAVDQILRTYCTLLSSLTTAAPHALLGGLNALDAVDARQIQEWSRATVQAPTLPTLASLFAAQAARVPQAVAVVCDGHKLTYAELNERAQRLALRLRALGAAPDTLVALYTERSVDMVVGVLGIVASGAAYLPIDTETPSARVAFMLEDAGVIAVITQRDLTGQLPTSSRAPTVLVDEELTAQHEVASFTPPALEPHHLAYVIYTSGSTGQPKGVMVTHENVARLFEVTQAEFQFSEADVWSLFHSIAFDFSVWELWGALLYGGRLVIVPKLSRDPVAFYELLASEGVTVLNQTPLAFRQLIPVDAEMRRPLALRLVIFGGEALDLPALEPWFALHGDDAPLLVNMYGITETTVHVTWCPLRRADTSSTASLIGRALPDLSLYLLDSDGRPVATGVPGEIHVGGAGLARGYLNRPELTAERFPEVTVFGQAMRLYRSGDQARWRGDGSLEYLGRIDHQVKLRGFRIELGEIEASLCLHPDVREATVVALGTAPHQFLAAYVVPSHVDSPLAVADLRQWLAARLPEYMVPAHLQSLPSLPMTVNGKVNRQALPLPAAPVTDATPATPPRDTLEAALVSIWEEHLARTGIGVLDDFFVLGGHSLVAMQIVSGIYRRLHVKVPLRTFFEHPTIETLAPVIRESSADRFTSIEPAPDQPDYPLSYAQQRIWLDAHIAQGANYNLPEALLIEGGLDHAALERALQALVARHEILRTAFVVVDGQPRQRVLPDMPMKVDVLDLRTALDWEATTQTLLQQEAALPFDLTQPPMIRARLLLQPGARTVLILVLHHIVGDAWSKAVLYQDLGELYNAALHHRPSTLPPLRLQYKDYAVWQQSQTFTRQRQYWTEQLTGAPPHLSLPRETDSLSAMERRHEGDRRGCLLSPSTSDALRQLAAARSTTVSNVLLALFKLLLFRLSRQADLCVSTAVAIRSHPDLAQLMGFFVNLLPIRTHLSAGMEFDQLLSQVTRTSYEALEQQDYPFDLLVREVGRAGGADARPFLDVVYVFQSTPHLTLATEGQAPAAAQPVQSLEFTFSFAKFDLCLVAADRGASGLHLSLEYDTQLFRGTVIEKYLQTLARFADMVAAPHRTD